MIHLEELSWYNPIPGTNGREKPSNITAVCRNVIKRGKRTELKLTTVITLNSIITSPLSFVCFIYRNEITRIYILGGPGSGKTTLANRISYQLTIPCYELDLIGWEKGVGAERPSEVRLREVHEIALQADWDIYVFEISQAKIAVRETNACTS